MRALTLRAKNAAIARRRRRGTHAHASSSGGYGGGAMRTGGGLGALVLGGVIGAGVGAGLTLWWYDRSLAPGDGAVAPTTPPPSSSNPADPAHHPALRFGVPVAGMLRQFEDYVSFFDPRTRNPLYTIERLTEASVSRSEGDRKRSEFVEDDAIPDALRNHLEDFRGSGYDRGHLAPAAAHRGSQSMLDETFRLSNISPQVGAGFNRDYWARFEAFVKSRVRDFGEVFVVTGPLFLPKPALVSGGQAAGNPDADASGGQPASEWRMAYPLLGQAPKLVSVPTHFYKVVLGTPKEGKDGKGGGRRRLAMAAFVMPNAPIPKDARLEDFLVPVDSLQAAAGVIFFPNLTIEGYGDGNGEREARSPNQTALPLPPSTSLAPVSKSKRVDHLCTRSTCELPAADWWKEGRKEGGAGPRAGSGRSGARKAFPSSKSSRR